MNNFIKLTGDTTFLASKESKVNFPVHMKYDDSYSRTYYIIDIGENSAVNPVKTYRSLSGVTQYLRKQQPGMMFRMWVGYGRRLGEHDELDSYCPGISAWDWICNRRVSQMYFKGFNIQLNTIERAIELWMDEARAFRETHYASAIIPLGDRAR